MYKFLAGGISRNVGNGISGISRNATARNFVHHTGNRSAGVWELKTSERSYAVGFARLTKFCHQFLLTSASVPLGHWGTWAPGPENWVAQGKFLGSFQKFFIYTLMNIKWAKNKFNEDLQGK